MDNYKELQRAYDNQEHPDYYDRPVKQIKEIKYKSYGWPFGGDDE